MKITLHRPNQIGGCITEIESNAGTKIFIDLGHLLPDGDKPANDKYASKEAVQKLTEGASAILYTHNHGDHVELFNLVPKSIPQYIGPLARKLMELKYQKLSVLQEQHDSCVEKLEKLAMFKGYERGVPFTIGDIEITPFFVSHSATDSYMLKVRCDGKTLLHTGDFREHGYLGGGLRRVLNQYHLVGHVDVLVIEGTNVGQPNKPVKSEEEVKETFKEIMSKRKNVFILSSSMDADRLESVYKANYSMDQWRPLVCDGFQKQIMLAIADEYKDGGPYYRFNTRRIYTYDWDSSKNVGLIKKMKECGFTMLIRKSDKFAQWINDILKFCKKEETSFVYSMYRGYVEEGMDGFSKESFDFIQPLVAGSTPCLKPDSKYDYNHTSGHASMRSLREVCEIIAPKTAIIPIHKNPDADYRTLGFSKELTNKIIEEDTTRDGIAISLGDMEPGQGDAFSQQHLATLTKNRSQKHV